MNSIASITGYSPSLRDTFFGKSNNMSIAADVIPTPKSKLFNSSNKPSSIREKITRQAAMNLDDQLSQDTH